LHEWGTKEALATKITRSHKKASFFGSAFAALAPFASFALTDRGSETGNYESHELHEWEPKPVWQHLGWERPAAMQSQKVLCASAPLRENGSVS
jgi:hypothetical protein